MKKFIYGLLLLLLVVTFPVKVSAAGSVTVSPKELTIVKGSMQSFDIVIDNAIGFAEVSSANESIAIVDKNYIDSGQGLVGTSKSFTVMVTGVSVGRTKVTVDVIDMTSYDGDDLNQEIDININVVEGTYLITYDGNGGTPAKTSETVVVGNSFQLPNATRSGYTLDGWYTAATGGDRVGTVGLFYTPSKSMTLYAQWKSTITTYTVSFDTKSGTPSTINPMTAQAGTTITLPSVTRSGFEFLGWSTTTSENDIVGKSGATYKPEGNVTLNAIWKAVIPTYTVSFDTKSGTPSTINSMTAQVGTTITLPSVTRTDYEFLGWSTTTSESDIVGKSGATYKPEGNVTLNAIWKKKTYTVTFNVNGGTTANTSVNVEVGNSMTLPSATKTGFEFLGWSTTTSASNIVGKSGDSYKPEADVTLIAIWKQNPYKVTFNVNGGSTVNTSVNVEVGSSITLPSTTRTNYEFLGWSTTTSASNIVGKSGATYKPEGNVTLTAIWKEKVVTPTTYNVAFNVNGGSSTATTQTVNIGSSITLPSVTRSGFEFLGWSTTTSESGIVGKAGGTYKPEGNVTLIAIWKQNPYKITFNANGGITANTSVNVEVGKSITLPVVTKKDYKFLGWSTTTDSTGIVGVAGISYTPERDITLTAIWKVDVATEFVVIYEANGGIDAPSSQVKTKDQTLVLSTKKPTKDKYEFICWNTEKDGTGTDYLAGGKYTVNADMILYAQWKLVGTIDKNPQTGDSTIFIVLAILLTFGGYAFWYTKKVKEN